jgi:hypothetical protein
VRAAGRKTRAKATAANATGYGGLSVSDALEVLAGLLRAEGGLIAAHVVARPLRNGPLFGELVASGPRAAADRDGYDWLVEAIREGYLLHYDGVGRVVACEDPDLTLLAGDRLYALGLERLVSLGDLAAVGELADVIALTALAHSRGQTDLAEAIWEAGARAVGWGSDPAHAEAKARARAGDADAAGALRAFANGSRRAPIEASDDILRRPSQRGLEPQES